MSDIHLFVQTAFASFWPIFNDSFQFLNVTAKLASSVT